MAYPFSQTQPGGLRAKTGRGEAWRGLSRRGRGANLYGNGARSAPGGAAQPGRKVLFEPLEPRLLLSADIMPVAAIVDLGLDALDDTFDEIFDTSRFDSPLNTRIPLIARAAIEAGVELTSAQLANLPFEAPTLQELLSLPVDLNFDGDSDSSSDEVLLDGFDTSLDGNVSFLELLIGRVTDELRAAADGVNDNAAFLAAVNEPAKDLAIDIPDTGDPDVDIPGLKSLALNFTVTDNSTDVEAGFILDLDLTVVTDFKLDLGLQDLLKGGDPDAPEPLDFDTTVEVTANLDFELAFGVLMPADGSAATQADFFIRPFEIDIDVTGTAMLDNAVVNIGFLETRILAGGLVGINAGVDIDFPDKPQQLGFTLTQLGETGTGMITAVNLAPAVLAEGVSFELRIGDGAEVTVDVAAGSDVVVQTNAALAAAGLTDVVTASLDLGFLKLALVDTDITPLGFAIEQADAAGTLTAAVRPTILGTMSTVEISFLLAVGAAAPRLVRVTPTPEDDDVDINNLPIPGPLTLDGLLLDINNALNTFINPLTTGNVVAVANNNGTPLDLTDDVVEIRFVPNLGQLAQSLETSKRLTLDSRIHAPELGLAFDLTRVVLSETAGVLGDLLPATASAFIPIRVTPGVTLAGGMTDLADDLGQIDITFSANPFDSADPNLNFDPATGRFDIAFNLGPNQDRFLAFTAISASDFTGLIGQLGGFLGEVSGGALFGSLEIPFAQAAVSDILDLADLVSDAILIDDQDTPETGDDVAKLLGTDNAPRFATAQGLAALAGQLGLGITGLEFNSDPDGIPGTDDKTLTFDFNISHAFDGIDLPVDFNLDLSPFLELSSDSQITLSASGRLELTLGVILGDAVPGSSILTGATLLGDIDGFEAGDFNNAGAFVSNLGITSPNQVDSVFGRLSDDAEFDLSVGAEQVRITVLAADTSDNVFIADLVADLQAAIDGSALTSTVTVGSDADGRLTLSSASGETIRVDAVNAVLGETGLLGSQAAESSGLGDPTAMAGNEFVEPASRASFTIEVDGTSATIATIAVDPASTAVPTVAALVTALNTAIADSELAGLVEARESGLRVAFTAIGAGASQITVKALDAGAGQVGFLGQQSGQGGGSTTLTAGADVREAVGRLSDDAVFEVMIGPDTFTVTIAKEATEANNNMLDVLVDVMQALSVASLHSGNAISSGVLSGTANFEIVLRSDVAALDGAVFAVSLAPDVANGSVDDLALDLDAAINAAVQTALPAFTDTLFEVTTRGDRLVITGLENTNDTKTDKDVRGFSIRSADATAVSDLGLTDGVTVQVLDDIIEPSAAGRLLVFTDATLAGFNLLAVGPNELGLPTTGDADNDGDTDAVADRDDFRITLRDGTTFRVSLDGDMTIGDVVDSINLDIDAPTHDPLNPLAAISDDGTSLVLTDPTPGAFVFQVQSVNASGAAQNLGIERSAPESETDTIRGDQIAGATLLDRFFVDGAQVTGTLDLAAPDTNINARFGFVGVGLTTAGTADDNKIRAQVSTGLQAPDGNSRVTLQQLFDNIDTLGQVVTTPTFDLADPTIAGNPQNNLKLALTLDPPILDLLGTDTPLITFTVDRLGSGFVNDIVSNISDFELDDDASFVLTLVSDDPDLNFAEIAVNLAASDTAGNLDLNALVADLNTALDEAFKNAFPDPLNVVPKQVEAVVDGTQLKLQVVAGTAVSQFGIKTSALDAAATALGFDHALPKISVLDNELNGLNLSLFSDLSFDDILGGLRTLSDFLGQFESFGFLNDPLPLVNVSVNDLIGFAERFDQAVQDAQNNPAGSLQVLEDALKEALGLPDDKVTIGLSLDDVANPQVLRFDTAFTIDFSESVGVDFDIGPDFARLAGGGELTASGSATIELDFGVGIIAGAGGNLGQVFLYNDDDDTDDLDGKGTGIRGDITLEGNGLAFNASLGLPPTLFPGAENLPPLSLGVSGGRAAIGASVSVLPDAAFVNGRIDLQTLLNDVSATVVVDGFIDSELPVAFGGLSLGSITIDAGDPAGGADVDFFTDIANNISVGAIVGGIPNSSLEDLVTQIDLSQLNIFDTVLLGVDAIDSFLAGLQDVLDGEVLGIPLPLIGDQLMDAARFIEDFRDSFVEPFRQKVETAQDFVADAEDPNKNILSQLLFDVLEPTGLLVFDDDGDPNTANVVATRAGLDAAAFQLGDVIRLDPATTLTGAIDETFVQWDFTLGQNLLDLPVDIGFDLGIPGLGLETEGAVNFALDWQLDLGFGISFEEGFFFNIADNSELEFNIAVTIPDVAVTGQLAFLQLQAKDADVTANDPDPNDPTMIDDRHLGSSVLSASFTVDVIEKGADADTADPTDTNDGDRLAFSELGRIGLTPGIIAEAAAELELTLGLNEDLVGGAAGVFPTIVSDFFLLWQLNGGFDGNNDPIPKPIDDNLDFDKVITDGLQNVEFQEVALDLGSFISDFIGPVLSQIQTVTQPIQPIVDFATAPLPVISDLGPEVTLIDLAGIFGKVNPDFIRAVADIITLINSIPTNAESIMIKFGDFVIFDDLAGIGMDLDLGSANTPLSSVDTSGDPNFSFDNQVNSQQASKTKSFTKNLTGTGGFSFPLLTDPSEVFGLLLGNTATLLAYDMPALELEFTYKQFFPIFGPLGASIGGTVGATVDFAFGFDTLGIQQFADTGFRDPGLIFNGFFVSDTPQPTGKGPDVPEVVFNAGLFATAELNLGVASGGVGGGVFATVNFDLFDPNRDGKIRIQELISNIDEQLRFGNPVLAPLAIFDVSGQVVARLFAFLEIDLLFFSVSFSENIVPPITLLSFNIPFVRAPILANELPDGVLQLNMGDFAAQRLNGDLRDIAETFVVTGSAQSLTVTATFNNDTSTTRSRTYTPTTAPGFTKIVAFGGEGGDTINLSGVSGNIAFELEGGVGNDTITSGTTATGQAMISGGAGDDTLTGGAGNDQIFGDEGNDTIVGLGGNNLIFGDGGRLSDQASARELGFRSSQDSSDVDLGRPSLRATGAAKAVLSADASFTIAFDDGVMPDPTITDITIARADTAENVSIEDLVGNINSAFVGTLLEGQIEALREGTFIRLAAVVGSAVTAFTVTSPDVDVAATSGFGAGNDDITSGGGNDIIFGGGGNDTVRGGGGNDIIVGDVGRIRLDAGAHARPADTERGLTAGEDMLFGDDGNDLIFGGKGDDTIEGGIGEDELLGQSGMDTILGGNDADLILGGKDGDTIFGGAGGDFLRGDDGNDTISGDGGDDTILTGRGTDTARGGGGQDTLISVVGDDVLDGGELGDTFQLTFQGGPVTRLVTIFDTGAAGDQDTVTISSTDDDDRFLLRAALNGDPDDGVRVPDTELRNIPFIDTFFTDGNVPDDELPVRSFVAMLNSDRNLERLNYYNLEKVNIESLDGNDEFFIDDTSAVFQIDSGAGNDRFQIGQLFRTERDAAARIDPFDVFETTSTTVGFVSNGVSEDLTINGGPDGDTIIVFRNRANLILNGDDGNDTFIVQAFALEGSTEPEARSRNNISVTGGADADFIQYAVNAPVNINGGDGFDTVIVIGTELGDDFVVTEDGVFGSGLNVNFIGVELLQVDGSAGDDRFFIQGTGVGFRTEVSGGLGEDTFNVGGNAPPIVSKDLLGHSGVVDHAVDGSATGSLFDVVKVAGISANVADNDEPAIRLVQSEGTTRVSEEGMVDSYFLVLTRPPSAPVRVTIVVPDPTTADKANGKLKINARPAAGTAFLEFTAANWFVPQEVMVEAQLTNTFIDLDGVQQTAVDNAVEGLDIANITHVVSGGDYDGLILPTVTVEIFDKDSPQLILTETDGNTTVTEAGGVDSYSLFLSQTPATGETVAVTISADAAGELLVSTDGLSFGATATFDFDDANAPQTVFVMAVDDGDREGLHKATITHSFTAGTMSGLEGPELLVDIGDDEAPHVLVFESAGSTDVIEFDPNLISVGSVSETQTNNVFFGNILTFNLDLGGVPIIGDAVLTVSAIADLNSTLEFLSFSAEGLLPQSLFVTGGQQQGLSTTQLTISAADLTTLAADGTVSFTVIPSLFVNNLGANSLTLSLSFPTAVGDPTAVAEAAGFPKTDSYQIALSAPPAPGDTVTVDVMPALTAVSNGPADLQVAVSTDGTTFTNGLQLTFDETNWDQPQTVFVAAIDDPVVDGDETKQFASRPQTLEGIQGPLIIDGFRSQAGLNLLNQDPLRLPGELNSQGFVESDVVTATPQTIEIDNDWQAIRDKDPAAFNAALAEGRLALDIADGVGADQEPIFITAIQEGVDSSVFTLERPFEGTLPKEGSGYAVIEISPNFFIDEADAIDVARVFNLDSLADNEATLTDNRLTGLLMGPEGIEYRNLENLTILLGSGDDEVDVLGTHKRLDFQTVTILNTGLGNDGVDVSLDGTDVIEHSGMVGSGTEQAINVGSALAAKDALRDLTLRVTSETGDIQLRKILGNEGGDITVVLPWDEVPNSGSTFEVIDQGDGIFALNTEGGDDFIRAGGSNLPLVLFGGGGIDDITGGAGADIIFGDRGQVDFLDEAGKIVTRFGSAPEPISGTVTTVADDLSLVDTTAMFPVENRGLAGLIVFIDEGAGNGQARLITGNSVDTLTVDRPWSEPLDETSQYSIATLPEEQTDGALRPLRFALTVDPDIGAADTINGGNGFDIVFGGQGGDTLNARGTDSAGDILLGDHGSASFDALGRPVVIRTTDTAEGGDDEITGGVGPNIILGGIGNDIIEAGGDASPDIILGDNGVVSFTNGILTRIATSAPEDGGNDKITTGDGPNVVLGGSGNDKIFGGEGAAGDIILGDNGEAIFNLAGTLVEIRTNTPLEGGNDTITAGDGTNRVLGGSGNDDITGGEGEDVILGDNGVAFFNDGAVLTLIQSTDTGQGGEDEIRAGNGVDVVLGGSLGDLILAGGGDDARDVVLGDNGLAEFTLGVLTRVATSSPLRGGDDDITTGNGPDVVLGGSGNDVILAATAGEQADIDAILALIGTGEFASIDPGDASADVILGDNGEANFDGAALLLNIRTSDPEQGGRDTIVGGNGPDVIFGGSGGDVVVAGGTDDAEDIVIGDNGRATFDQSEAFDPGEESATLSFNFNASSSSRTVTGTAGAGDARADNWNNLAGDGPQTFGDEAGEIIVFDDGAIAPGITIEWGEDLDTAPDDLSTDSHGQIFNPSTEDERLFEGYLHTSTNHTIGVNIAGLSGHFETYDLYVYLDADNSHSKAGTSVRGITDGSTTFYLDDADGNTFTGTYVRVDSTDPNAPQTGNYVVFEGLTGDVASIRIDDDGTLLASSANRPAITAVQLVGQSNPIDRIESTDPAYGGGDIILTGGGADIAIGGSGADVIETFGPAVRGEVDADIVVGDNARATFMNGELREIRTTAPDIGGDDTIRTGNGEDIVLGGIGGDDIDTGVGDQSFDNGDLTVLSVNFNSGVAKGVVTGVAGAVQVDNWNNLPSEGSGDDDDHDGRRSQASNNLVFDNGDLAEGVTIEWGRSLDSTSPKAAGRDTHSEIHSPGTQNERLFEGYVFTEGDKVLGADIRGLDRYFDSANPYDVYVYIDADDGKSRSGISVDRITDGITSFYLNDADGNTFAGEFVEVGSTDPLAPETGNYVVFRNLTSATVSIRIENDRTLVDSSSNKPAITAIQIVGGADKGAVTIGGDFEADAVVGDNGVARLFDGALYELVTSHPALGGDDTIVTGEGPDLAIGGSGSDTLDGAAGHDLLLGDNARLILFDGEVVGLGGDHHHDHDDHGHHFFDHHSDHDFDPFELLGIQLLNDDVGGDDTLIGGTDDDLIYGQLGNDIYVFADGGLGNDLLVEAGDENVRANDPHDRLDFSAFIGPIEIDLSNEGHQTVNGAVQEGDVNLRLVLFSKTAFEQVVGSVFDDEIEGNDRNNALIGLAGDDELRGEKGDDVLLGSDGDDEIHGGRGDDLIDGGAGQDKLRGDSADDDDDDDDDKDDRKGGLNVIFGGDGDDDIKGGGDDDLIDGEGGADKISGGGGDDVLLGGDGDDRIDGNGGRDIIEGGGGLDRISSGGRDSIEQDTGAGPLGLFGIFQRFDLFFDFEGFFFVDPTGGDPTAEDRPPRLWVEDFLATVPGNGTAYLMAAGSARYTTLSGESGLLSSEVTGSAARQAILMRVFHEELNAFVDLEEARLLSQIDGGLEAVDGNDDEILDESIFAEQPVPDGAPVEAAADATGVGGSGIGSGIVSGLSVDWSTKFTGFLSNV